MIIKISSMFSHTTEYALRAMVYLANNAAVPLTAQQIAQGTGVPTGYLSKVLLELIRAGLVKSRRGICGGYSLALAPEKVNLMDIINVFHPIERVEACPMKDATHDALCPLHQHLDAAVLVIQHMFGATTLADLVREFRAWSPLNEVCPGQTSGSHSNSFPREVSGD